MRERLTVDLSRFRDPGVRVFIGRDHGLAIREACGVMDGSSVRLVVPMDVFCLTSGFVIELLRGVTDMEFDGPAHLGLSIAESLDAARRIRSWHESLARATPYTPATPTRPAAGAERPEDTEL
jgi:hypothetical protein